MTQKRVAIVTGGSRGIGEAIVRRLAEDGLHVVACARSADRLEKVVESVRAAGGSAESAVFDVVDFAALEENINRVAETHGRLDVLVNNAGITRDMLFLRMSDEEFDQVINTNLKSVFVACRAASRYIMRSKSGRIINIGSVSGVVGNAGQANYAASKAGVIGLSKTIGKELAGKGVTCNVIAPGFIVTEMTDVLNDKIKEYARSLIPMKRFGQPEEIASVVSFFASEQASYVTGQVVLVDGGMAM
ncbi:MAG: 3-oxoacyl-[acyl-carrier-protein] reductase [Phycisphaerae bacterium]|nr:3-oxoacyl-[acyl-carrier-protein] reductase [Phycisphaerae bacterium]MDW8263234.1 3-oxoacyl-[acyl-carrier-protein] reductase [Phycisphaerales bacterium]